MSFGSDLTPDADIDVTGERGTPDDEIEKCDCGVLFRTGGWHLCKDTGERVEWEDYNQ